jgi:FSR family fosmidomycin resistance protein-like MFS transporter
MKSAEEKTVKMNWKALTILSIAHMITDVNQGALPALLPFFKESLNLSYTMAGGILLFGNLTSSVIQPLFGYLSDKRSLGWLLYVGPFIACLGMAVTGLMPNYLLLVSCVIISGFGIAGYHPEGFKTAYFFTGEKKATGMSIFTVGGNLGIALGPILSLFLVTAYGLKGTLGLVVPGILMAGVIALSIRWLTTPVRLALNKTKEETEKTSSKSTFSSLSLLIAIVIIRAWIQAGLITYIPFYYIDYLKGNPIYAAKLVSTFLTAGAIGTLVGAPLADRWGHKTFLCITIILLFPLLLLFYNTQGLITFVILAIAGMVLISTTGVVVVIGQTLLPQNLGVASGLVVGFGVGTGGIGVTLLGVIADAWGVPVAMKAILLLPLIGFGLSLLMEYPPKK